MKGALVFDELQLRLHPAASRVQKLAAAHPAFRPEALERLDPRRCVEARRSHGGTAPERVADQLVTIEAILQRQESALRN